MFQYLAKYKKKLIHIKDIQKWVQVVVAALYELFERGYFYYLFLFFSSFFSSSDAIVHLNHFNTDIMHLFVQLEKHILDDLGIYSQFNLYRRLRQLVDE